MMTAAISLAHLAQLRHNWAVAKTNATWFSSQNVPGRTTASRRYFYVRTHLCAFFGRAIAGRAHALPVPLDAGLLTLLSARPPHLAVGSGSNPSKEAAMRANTLARPEQSPLVSPLNSPVPLAGYDAGKEAARAWFEQLKRSAADHRDAERCAFVRALEADDSEAALASILFNQGFAEGIALAIAGVRHG